jgi:hypothetical protein
MTLRQHAGEGFDVVFGDAFGGLAVPWHLTTYEFLEEIRRVARPDAVYVMNLIDYGPLDFARAELATLWAAFRNVAFIATPSADGFAGGTFVMLASDAAIDLSGLEAAVAERSGRREGAGVRGRGGGVDRRLRARRSAHHPAAVLGGQQSDPERHNSGGKRHAAGIDQPHELVGCGARRAHRAEEEAGRHEDCRRRHSVARDGLEQTFELHRIYIQLRHQGQDHEDAGVRVAGPREPDLERSLGVPPGPEEEHIEPAELDCP